MGYRSWPPSRPRSKRVMAPSIPLEELPREYERLLGGQSRFLKTIVRF
jgi:hypothetical protein